MSKKPQKQKKTNEDYFKPKKKQPKRRLELHEYASATLGAGNIREAVKLPKNEDEREWLAVNIVDFFNQISLLYGIITDYCTKKTCPIMAAGPKYEYLWMDGIKYKEPYKCSAPEYVDLLMEWVENQINNSKLFPVDDGDDFPKNFKKICKTILKRLFRVYGIYNHVSLYHCIYT